MLISTAIPPLPMEGMNGLSQGDPFSALFGGVLNAGASIFSTITQAGIAKKQQAIEKAALQEQKTVDWRNWALQQAAVLTQPSQTQHTEQVIALGAIGGVALIISAIFLISATRKKAA